MARWVEIAAAEVDFARRVQERFDLYTHKTIATLRRDGSPRISGIEAEFNDGDIWLGMMPGSLKARDLRRDPRLALHSGTEDPLEGDAMAGRVVDAKLAGVATEVPSDGEDAAHRFRIDVTEVVLISVSDPPESLVIETWRAGRGLRRVERR
jgi:hypothetical protein